MIVAAKPRYTVEEFLALPEDPNVERWLKDGYIQEYNNMTRRNRLHGRATITIGIELEIWLRTQPLPRGYLGAGDVGVRMFPDRNVVVGVDIVYFDAATLAAQGDDSTMFIGVPTLAVEVLSPSNTVEEIDDKLELYLDAGVPHIWLADPRMGVIIAYRARNVVQAYSGVEEIDAAPHMPGLRCSVASFFA